MKKLNISQVSVFFANGSYPIEFLLYYPQKINTNRLRRALKKLSGRFWPVFGKYENGTIYEQKYQESNFYAEEKVNKKFDSTINQEELYFQFGEVISKAIDPLFFVKALQYTNGTVLIIKMNHLVGDGYSFFYLLSVLAATTKQAGKPFVPAIIGALSRPKLKSSLHAKFHFSEKTREIDSSYEDLIVEVMEVGQSETREQAKKITEKIGMRISTNDILCAQLLKLILQSKKQISGSKINLVIPVDMRRAVKELGQRFFGNGLILHRVSFDKKEVAKKEVEALAIKIRENFPKRDVKKYMEFLQSIESKINAKNFDNLQLYDPEKEFLVTNLTRMPITRLDFGSGLPVIIVPLTRGRSGAAILAQNDKFILQLGR